MSRGCVLVPDADPPTPLRALAAALDGVCTVADAVPADAAWVLAPEWSLLGADSLPAAGRLVALLDGEADWAWRIGGALHDRLRARLAAADAVFVHDPRAVAAAELLVGRPVHWLGLPAPQAAASVAGEETARGVLLLDGPDPDGPPGPAEALVASIEGVRPVRPAEAMDGGIGGCACALTLDRRACFGVAALRASALGLPVVGPTMQTVPALLHPELAVDPVLGLDEARDRVGALVHSPARRAACAELGRVRRIERFSPGAVRRRFADGRASRAASRSGATPSSDSVASLPPADHPARC